MTVAGIVILILLISSIFICLFTIFVLVKQKRIFMVEAQKQFKRAEFNVTSKKLLELWLRQKHEGKELGAYFKQNKIGRVAIYGMTQIGAILYTELQAVGVKVECGIDRSGKTGGTGITSKKPEDLDSADLKGKVDAIIVTPIYDFAAIYDMLYEKVGDDIPILGLDEILCEI